jgi:hypothetical protein
VNNIKFGVLACGVIGLIACFLPQISIMGHSISVWDAHKAPTEAGGGMHVYVVLAGYAVAAIMGVLAVVKAPMQRWQAIVALLGFGIVVVKSREGLKHFGDFAIGGKLMIITMLLGVVCSVIALAKPETAK